MAHVTSGKVKTNMFLIWCGPDGEGIYDKFELGENEMYDTDHIIEQFELYCEPICNFCAARYKFQQVSQRENEMTTTFYHHIQCQFSDNEEHLVDAIIYGTRVHKAREKLLKMPKHLTLQDCLKICHHYESLQYHLNVVNATDKPVESITKCHFNRGGKQQQPSAKKTVHLEVNLVPDQQILLIVQSHVVIVVRLIPKIDAQLISQFPSDVTELVIICLCADPAVPVLPKIQGSSTDFMVEAEHPEVEDLLKEDRSMKQLRFLKPSQMTNLT